LPCCAREIKLFRYCGGLPFFILRYRVTVDIAAPLRGKAKAGLAFDIDPEEILICVHLPFPPRRLRWR
jgi:hypothetical protein